MRETEIVIRLRVPSALGKRTLLVSLLAIVAVSASAVAFGVLPSTPPTFQSGATLTADSLNALSADVSNLDGRVSGLEGPVARYATASNQSLSSGTTINFDTRTYDSANAVTPGTGWHFTVPVSGAGRYEIHSVVTVSLASVPNTNGYSLGAFLVKNGVNVSAAYHHVVVGEGGGGYAQIVNTDTLVLAAGDSLTVQLNSSAPAVTLVPDANYNYITIARVGPVVQ
jgi:hypothetical protein